MYQIKGDQNKMNLDINPDYSIFCPLMKTYCNRKCPAYVKETPASKSYCDAPYLVR